MNRVFSTSVMQKFQQLQIVAERATEKMEATAATDLPRFNPKVEMFLPGSAMRHRVFQSQWRSCREKTRVFIPGNAFSGDGRDSLPIWEYWVSIENREPTTDSRKKLVTQPFPTVMNLHLLIAVTFLETTPLGSKRGVGTIPGSNSLLSHTSEQRRRNPLCDGLEKVG